MRKERYRGSTRGHRGLAANDRGQVQIMEIITAGLIMMGALNFISTLTDPTVPTPDENEQLRTIVTDTLSLLRSTEPLNSSYSSRLDEMICTDDIADLSADISDALDPAFSFNIVLFSNGPGDGYPILSMGSPTGPTVVGHRLMVLSGGSVSLVDGGVQPLHCGLYDIRIPVWNEPRTGTGVSP